MAVNPQEDSYHCQEEGCNFSFTGEQYSYILTCALKAGWKKPSDKAFFQDEAHRLHLDE